MRSGRRRSSGSTTRCRLRDPAQGSPARNGHGACVPSQPSLPARQLRACLPRPGTFSRAHVGGVDVDARVDVVDQVPAEMIGIVIDDEIVATIPAPVGADRPIPGCHDEREPSGYPEAALIPVDPDDFVTERTANAVEPPVFVRARQPVTRVIRAVAPIPAIVIHVGQVVRATGADALGFRSAAPWPAARFRWNVTLIRSRRIVAT